MFQSMFESLLIEIRTLESRRFLPRRNKFIETSYNKFCTTDGDEIVDSSFSPGYVSETFLTNADVIEGYEEVLTGRREVWQVWLVRQNLFKLSWLNFCRFGSMTCSGMISWRIIFCRQMRGSHWSWFSCASSTCLTYFFAIIDPPGLEKLR